MTDIMPVTGSLILKASKRRFAVRCCVTLVFFLIGMFADFPDTVFFFAFRILLVSCCSFAMAVFMSGIITNRYDAVLNPKGIEFGSFYGRRRYRWSEIRAAGVICPVTGKRVFIELRQTGSSDKSARLPLAYLPDTYGMDPDELAQTILRWQREYCDA